MANGEAVKQSRRELNNLPHFVVHSALKCAKDTVSFVFEAALYMYYIVLYTDDSHVYVLFHSYISLHHEGEWNAQVKMWERKFFLNFYRKNNFT